MKPGVLIITAIGFWFSFNLISYRNSTIDSAHNAYHSKEYVETLEQLNILSDSLEVEDDGIQLNIAHTIYHLNGFSGPNGTNVTSNADSVFLSRVQSSIYEYNRLWESEDILASKGYHQAGMVTFKSRVVNNAVAEEADLINSSMDYFKNALRRDPFNEKARYNYEILKKYKEFPEQLMKRVHGLVELRRYVDAYTLLAPYAENDSRFVSHKEYAKRLSDIVNIETQTDGS